MKALALHTDFRIYWPARLAALHRHLATHGITLAVVEIAGEGSPYAFAGKTTPVPDPGSQSAPATTQNPSPPAKDEPLPGHILFPQRRMETISGAEIKPPLFRLLDRLNPDVIIAGAIAFPSGALAVAWANSRRRRVIIFDDSKISVVRRSGVVNAIKRAVYNGVDALIFPASSWQPTGAFWGFTPERLFYGIDAVDNDFWAAHTPSADTAKPFFLAVGRMLEIKNFPTLIAAYAKYADRVGEDALPLTMIGDGPLRPGLIRQAGQLGVAHRITFLPFKTQTELRDFYHRCAAFILPSHEETWGLVINEAMASGAPVIASRQCSAAEELIREGVNGYTFNHDDPDTLALHLAAIHSLTPTRRAAMSQASLDIIAQWGLPRFCQGCHDAILYATSAPTRTPSLLDRLIIKMWKGRYRPK